MTGESQRVACGSGFHKSALTLLCVCSARAQTPVFCLASSALLCYFKVEVAHNRWEAFDLLTHRPLLFHLHPSRISRSRIRAAAAAGGDDDDELTGR